MNVEVLNLKNATVEEISKHVENYGSMSIPDMIFIDQELERASEGKFNLIQLLDNLQETADPVNKELIRRISGNFELYRDILRSPNL